MVEPAHGPGYALPQRPGVEVRPTSPVAPSLPPSLHAWALLARGEARAARTEFAVLALRDPRDAAARTGYGLAAAALGHHEKAVWAMRRAVVTDAAAFDRLAIDTAGQPLVRQLLAHYARTASDTGNRDLVDSLFMVSALCVLLDDREMARAAIAIVLQMDGPGPAAKILGDLLDPADEADELLPIAAVAVLDSDRLLHTLAPR